MLIVIFILCAFSLYASTNIVTNTNLQDGLQNSINPTVSILRLLGAFIFVVALFLIGVWVFKNWRGLVFKNVKKSNLKVVEVKHIGNRQALFVVGYNRKRMLLGVTSSTINFLSELPDDEDAQNEPAADNPSITSILNKISGVK
jgi:flagellar biogenesis protein FliO